MTTSWYARIGIVGILAVTMSLVVMAPTSAPADQPMTSPEAPPTRVTAAMQPPVAVAAEAGTEQPTPQRVIVERDAMGRDEPHDKTPAELIDELASCPAAASDAEKTGNGPKPAVAGLPLWNVTNDMIDRVCSQNHLSRRPANQIPKLIFAVMFGLEFDMLEVVLHEVVPVADFVFVTESSVTHSLGSKPLHYSKQKALRYSQFESTGKIKHLVYTPVRQYKSGWDVEKRQRNHFLRHLSEVGVSTGDVIVGNIDLDEIFSRETLIKFKYCESPSTAFKLAHFRYNTNCLQEVEFSTYFDTAFVWNDQAKKMKIDLYSRRRNRNSKPIDTGDGIGAGLRRMLRDSGAWHFTAFGGVEAVMAKYRNSPHRFVGELRRDDVVKVIRDCSYQGVNRTRLPFDAKSFTAWFKPAENEVNRWPATALPYALVQRPCAFALRGWFG